MRPRKLIIAVAADRACGFKSAAHKGVFADARNGCRNGQRFQRAALRECVFADGSYPVPVQNVRDRDVLQRLIRKRDDGCAIALRKIVYKIARYAQLLRVEQKVIVAVDIVDLFSVLMEIVAKNSIQFFVIHIAFFPSFLFPPRSIGYAYIIIRIRRNCKPAKISTTKNLMYRYKNMYLNYRF